MSRPVFEPSLTRTDEAIAFGSRQLFRRPGPRTPSMNAWVWLNAGATTIPHNTVTPVPFPDICYDPALFTKGDPFDWTSTDTGDPGNFRWEVECATEGWYYYDIVCSMYEVTTDGTNDFAYMMLNGQPVNSSFIPIDDSVRDSADWFMASVGSSGENGEVTNNPYLHVSGTIWMPGNAFWQPDAQQTTGVDRDLVGDKAYFEFLGPTQNTDWTCDTAS